VRFGAHQNDDACVKYGVDPLPLAGMCGAGELRQDAGRNALHGFTASVVMFTAGSTGPA
jgi:small ligand-binding sensory domain FIST